MNEPQYIYVKEKPKTGCLTQVVAAFLVLLLVMFIISLVSFSTSESKTSSSQPTKPEGPAIEVYEKHARRVEFGGMEITGIVRNKCRVSLDSLSIRFSVFDSKDNKLGDAVDFISGLDAGGTWKFKAIASESGAFRLDGVQCSFGQLYAKDLDEERREEIEKQAVIEQEQQKLAAENAKRVAEENKQLRQQESARTTFEFWSRKATNGDGAAQLRLGQLYLTGHGTETNLRQARFWLFCASTNGETEATKLLQTLLP